MSKSLVDPDELVNVTEIAVRAGVPRTNVNAWTRGKTFPPALGDPSAIGGRIYRWPDVQAWIASRDIKTG